MEKRRQIRLKWENTQNNLSNIFISFHYYDCSFLLCSSFVICSHYSSTTNQCTFDVGIPQKFAVAHDPESFIEWSTDWELEVRILHWHKSLNCHDERRNSFDDEWMMNGSRFLLCQRVNIKIPVERPPNDGNCYGAANIFGAVNKVFIE